MLGAGDSGEFPIAVVAVKIASPEVVGHIQVRPPVSVTVTPGAGETVAVVIRVQPRCLSPILKGGVSFIVEQEVRRSIAGVKIRHGIVILVQTQVVAIEAEINVEASVAIIVSDSRVGKRSLGRPRKPEGVALEQEFSLALVEEKQRAAAAHHQKILNPLVLEIREQCASCAVKDIYSCGLGHVLKGSIAAIAVEPVGKASGLTDIKIIQSVVVDISHRQAVVSVDVDATGSVENRAPMVDAAKHLIFVRFILAESLRRNVEENWLAGSTDNFSGRFPGENAPSAGLIARPPGLPMSNTFLAPHTGARADQVIADSDVD